MEFSTELSMVDAHVTELFSKMEDIEDDPLFDVKDWEMLKDWKDGKESNEAMKEEQSNETDASLPNDLSIDFSKDLSKDLSEALCKALSETVAEDFSKDLSDENHSQLNVFISSMSSDDYTSSSSSDCLFPSESLSFPNANTSFFASANANDLSNAQLYEPYPYPYSSSDNLSTPHSFWSDPFSTVPSSLSSFSNASTVSNVSNVSNTSNSCLSVTAFRPLPPHLVSEDKRTKNRERVRKCRKRKEDRVQFLEQQNDTLRKDNKKLKVQNQHFYENGVTEDVSTEERSQMEKRQTKTLEQMEQLLLTTSSNDNDRSVVSQKLEQLFDSHVRILYAPTGLRSTSIQSIVEDIELGKNIFKYYNVKRRDTVRIDANHLRVTWEITVTLFDNTENQPNEENERQSIFAPFPFLRHHIGETTLTFKQISHYTFCNEKILEEIRIIDMVSLLEALFALPIAQQNPAFVQNLSQILQACRS